MILRIEDRSQELQRRLRERLARAETLLCPEHGKPIESLTIHGFGNGWFDARYTTCCSALEAEAAAIVKDRC
ncbi:MAG TPA: hypothetical protein VGE86_07660 [Thermoanaerobaculia bacterium]